MVSRRSGYSGVRLSKATLCLIASGLSKLITSAFIMAKYRSPSRGARMGPSTVSPVRRPNFRTWDGET